MYRYLAGKHLHFPRTILNGTNKQITKISTLNIKTVPEVKHACTYISLELKFPETTSIANVNSRLTIILVGSESSY